MKKININYNETFGTKHSRDYYRGLSFHYSGKWVIGTHYISDDYNIDYVVHGQCLLACAKSHLSSLENEPTEYIYDSHGNITGVVSQYWDFVLSGMNGSSCAVKIIDNYWYICNNANVPEEEQIWVNTGVKATFEYDDLTEEQKEDLRAPILEDIEHRLDTSTYLTTSEMNEIVAKPEPPEVTVIYTEDWYCDDPETCPIPTPDEWANEVGYKTGADYRSWRDFEDMFAEGNHDDDFDEICLYGGSRKFIWTDETFEFEGVVYDLWKAYSNDNDTLDWDCSFGYVLCPHNISKTTLLNNCKFKNENNNYCPFVAAITDDNVIYRHPFEMFDFTLMYAK